MMRQPNLNVFSKSLQNDDPKGHVLKDDICLSDAQYALPIYFTLDYQRTFVNKSGLIHQIKKTSVPLDIDLHAFLYDDAGQLVEMVWYKNLRDISQNIRHHGDERLGKKKPISTDSTLQTDTTQQTDELESIEMRLQHLPTHIRHITLTASTFSHAPLNAVSEGSIHLQDSMGSTLQHIDLTALPHDSHTLWVATLSRHGFDWRLKLHHTHINNGDNPLSEMMAKLPKNHDAKNLATLLGQWLFKT